MDTKGRLLIAGSHNRNEFILIDNNNAAADYDDQEAAVGTVTSVKELLSGQICQICGDEIEITTTTTTIHNNNNNNKEPFIACNECAFPICRPCYEYERREGNQSCPQCKTRFKRIKGSPRVDGDEDEDDFDDLDNEFHHHHHPLLHSSSYTNGNLHDHHPMPSSEIPLLTNGQEDDGISADKHALIIPPFMKRIHPIPFSNTASTVSFPPRAMDPKKDLAVYGYGTVAWKDRMDEWHKRQNDKLQMVKHHGDNDVDDPDLPKMDKGRQPLSRKLPISSSKINPYRMVWTYNGLDTRIGLRKCGLAKEKCGLGAYELDPS